MQASWRAPGRRPGAEAVVVSVLAVALVLSRLRFVQLFGTRWTDEDQALLWFAATDLLEGHVREPYFFGQPYGSWFEALVGVPMLAFGAAHRWALPLAGSLLGTLPWLLFAAVAWWRPGRRSAVLAAGILGWPLAMSVEGVAVSTMPRGLLPGLVLGCVVVAVVVWFDGPPPSWALALFGLGLVGAASLNVGSGLVTGPVAVSVVLTALSARRWRALGALAGGLVGGGAGHLLAQSFYGAYPIYDLHPAPTFSFAVERLARNLDEAGRYLSAYAPEAWRWWGWPALALVSVAVWVAASRRSLPAVAAAVTAVVLAVGVLGTSKADDGVPFLFFPWSRVYLGLPWAVAALSLLPSRGGRRPGAPSSPLPLLLGVAALALASLVVREVAVADRTADLVGAAEGQPPVIPVETSDLARRCELRLAAAARFDVDVVVDRYDRTAAYGCAALLAGDGITTVFPEYERRSWLVLELRDAEVERFLVSGLDTCPVEAERCSEFDRAERLYLVAGEARVLADWFELLGLTMRTGWRA